MNAKDLLLQYDNYDHREKILKNFLSSQREMISSLDLNSVWIPKETKEIPSLLEKKLRIYEEELVRISIERQKILDLISEIPGVEGEVLTRRYINGEIWDEICESMFYSWSYVHRIHRRALQIVQERLDQRDLFDT